MGPKLVSMAWKARDKRRKHKNGEAAEWSETAPEKALEHDHRHPAQFRTHEQRQQRKAVK